MVQVGGGGKDSSFPECVDSVVNTGNLTPTEMSGMIGHVDSLKLCFFVFGFYLVVLEEINLEEKAWVLRLPNLPPPSPTVLHPSIHFFT